MELCYGALKEEIINLFGESKVMVLATSSNSRVTARSMSCVFNGINIMFQTDETFAKVSQIKENPSVALCINNLQIEGMAIIKGHPLNNENKSFINKFKEQHEGSYYTYSHLKNETVIEVIPTLITIWKYENGKPLRDFLVVSENRAIREYYDTSI
jgi:general stress protein 26